MTGFTTYLLEVRTHTHMLPFIGALLPLLGKVAGGVTDIISKKVEDKDLANQLNAEITRQLMSTDHNEYIEHLKQAGSIIKTEANSQSWLARNWRPGLMCLFGVIVANNYVIFPYLQNFLPDHAVLLPIPADLWQLLKLGIGGYVVGRSGEKIVQVLKEQK